MTISADLQERYTSEVDVDWRAALILSHPSATTQYLVNHTEPLELARASNRPGRLFTFTPVPIEIVLPGRDDSGNSDMGIVICGVQTEALDFLYQALEDATQPITCSYSVYILGDPLPQIEPWLQFQLTGITVTDESVAATASRSNVVNMPFPTQVYRLSSFPGLRRR
jgi:hypothetical protein